MATVRTMVTLTKRTDLGASNTMRKLWLFVLKNILKDNEDRRMIRVLRALSVSLCVIGTF